MLKYILGTVAAAVLFALVGGMIGKMWDISDRQDCYKWQLYAQEFEGFYLTRSEAAQCAYWHIEVEAPIR